MAKKVLFCATVDYHFKAFHLPYLKWFKENGWEVHIAAKGELELPYVDKKYNLLIERSPVCFNNITAYKELKQIIENGHYQIIHCHTPMGSVLARLAARKVRKNGTRVIYTAHGFHFYRGAPTRNWLVFYPIERWLAQHTDCLITINQEDYNLANNKFRVNRIEHVHGVGVDTEKYKPVSREERNLLRKKHGYTEDHFLLFYAAELNFNKNQFLLIKSMANLRKDIPNVKLLLAGNGPLYEEYRAFAVKEAVSDVVEFLGYRTDINELITISDVAVASSFREGLPVNITEAMACGLPIVASRNRGHSELVVDGVNGYVVSNNDDVLFAERLKTLYENPGLCVKMGNESIKHVAKYQLAQVAGEMSRIYQFYM